MTGRTVKARYHCRPCGGDGNWFLVAEDKVWTAVQSRRASHQAKCPAVALKSAAHVPRTNTQQELAGVS